MSKKICKHVYCYNEFPVGVNGRQYCCSACRDKARKYRRYHEDKEYNNKQNTNAKLRYKKLKEQNV